MNCAFGDADLASLYVTTRAAKSFCPRDAGGAGVRCRSEIIRVRVKTRIVADTRGDCAGKRVRAKLTRPNPSASSSAPGRMRSRA